MKNNKGFGKFEVLTIIVLLLCIFAYLAYHFLGGVSVKKLSTMKDSASSMAKAVIVNKETFHNPKKVYLAEILDEQLMKEIKNPAGEGNCSHSESFVELGEHNNYVTLQCGAYLLDHVDVNEIKEAPFYQVGEWTTKKTNDDDQERVLYNCKENGKDLFMESYDDLYFVYQVNRMYSTNYYDVSGVRGLCEVKETTMYRTKVELEK